MKEILIGGRNYLLVTKLDAFSQLHVARKLGPALPIVEGLVDLRNAEKDKSILTVLMLSHIADSDAEYIITKCLGVVSRRQADGTMAKLMHNGELMFDDTPMTDMLTLAVAVIEENLGDFFRTALTRLQEESQKAAT